MCPKDAQRPWPTSDVHLRRGNDVGQPKGGGRAVDDGRVRTRCREGRRWLAGWLAGCWLAGEAKRAQEADDATLSDDSTH